MKKHTISSMQVGTMVFFFTRSLFLLFGFSFLFPLTQNDTILVPILGSVFGLLLLGLFFLIFDYQPNEGLYQKLRILFPRVISLTLQIILFVFLFFLGSYLLYHITNYLNYSLAHNFSLFVLAATFLLLCFYLAIKGIETMARTSEIFLFLTILFVMISGLGLFSFIQLDYIRPLLISGPFAYLKSAIYYGILSTGPVFLLLFLPKKEIVEQTHLKKRIIIGYLASSFLIFLFLFLSLSILGIDLTLLYRHPETIILKKVTFLKIIERLEAVLSIHWLFDLVLLLSFLLYALKEGGREIIKIKTEKKKNWFLFIVCIFLLFGSIYIPHIDIYYRNIYLFLVLVLPAIFGICIFFQNTKKSR